MTKLKGLLDKKVIVITGATSGIGLALSRLVVSKGAYLIGIGRTQERCSAVLSTFRELTGQNVAFIPAELSLLGNVKDLADEIRKQMEKWNIHHLDALVLNAATVPFRQTITQEGFDTQWVVNYLSGFLLTNLLLEDLTNAKSAFVISISSDSHYRTGFRWDDIQLLRNYNPLLAYKQAKLAQVVFSAEFNRRLKHSTGITALAADPGLVNTDIGVKGKSLLMKLFWQLRRRNGRSPESAAEDILFLLEREDLPNTDQIYWKFCQPKPANRLVYDEQAGKRLWEISMKMAGLEKRDDAK